MSRHALFSTIYMWRMCAGRRAESQLESCLYAQTEVTRCIFCLCVMQARKWKCQWRLWFSCKMHIKLELHMTCHRYAIVCLKGNVFFKCGAWSWPFVAHSWVFNVWTHPGSWMRSWESSSCLSDVKSQYVEMSFWLACNFKRGWDFMSHVSWN